MEYAPTAWQTAGGTLAQSQEQGSHVDAERGDPEARRGDPRYQDVATQGPLTTPRTSPRTSPEGARKRAATYGKDSSQEALRKRPGWTERAGKAWATTLGGTAPFGRIGKALKPLVDQHGENEVLVVWAKYLAEEPAQFVTPEQFASKFGIWRNGRRTRSAEVCWA